MVKLDIKRNWRYWVGGSLILLVAGTAAVVGWSGGSSNPPTPAGQPVVEPAEPPTPAEEAPPAITPGQPQDQTPDQPSPEPPATNPSVVADGPLPANWDQLSEAEKIAANPRNCQPDSNGAIQLDLETGDCRAVPASDDEDEANNPPDQQPPDRAGLGFNQKFLVNLEGLRLEVKLTGFECARVDRLASNRVGDKAPQDIQQAFDGYNSGQPSAPGDRLSTLAAYSEAFSYLNNLQAHLSQNQARAQSTAELWQRLAGYKECLAQFEATNVGDDWTFSDGCKLDYFDRYLKAKDSQAGENYQPLYLGGGWACTQALVPFPTGDSTRARVYFTLPVEAAVDSLIVNDGQSDPVTIVGIDSGI